MQLFALVNTVERALRSRENVDALLDGVELIVVKHVLLGPLANRAVKNATVKTRKDVIILPDSATAIRAGEETSVNVLACLATLEEAVWNNVNAM